MRKDDFYTDPAFDPDAFSEEDFWREVYDDSSVYAVSVLNPFLYRQAVCFTEKLKAILNEALAADGKTADYVLEFDRQLGLDLRFSIRLPETGFVLTAGILLMLLENAPGFDFDVTPLPRKHVLVCLTFKDVKTVLELQ